MKTMVTDTQHTVADKRLWTETKTRFYHNKLIGILHTPSASNKKPPKPSETMSGCIQDHQEFISAHLNDIKVEWQFLD